MERVVTGMAQPRTAMSPEWDRWFDETFADLVSADEEFARDEFDALIAASWSPSASEPHRRRRPTLTERASDQ